MADPPERDVLNKLLPGLRINAARESRSLPSDDSLWLWNAQPDGFVLPVGEQVDAELLDSIPPGEALRLVNVDQALWSAALSPNLNPPADQDLDQGLDFWDQNRYADLLAPEPLGERVDAGTALAGDQAIRYRGRQIPVFTGSGPLGQAMACLEMLARYYNVPFRRDVLERAARHAIGNHSVSLEQLGNLSTILGFTGSLADIPETQYSRLPFPCFVVVQGQPAMIHDVQRGVVRAVLPEYGRVELPLEELSAGQSGARVLMLNPGRDTQQRKLGLSWFFPQIKKYRRSLIEVFVASLVLQLLNLAQPLVMQQIFDKVIGQQNLDTLYTLGLILLGVSLFQGVLGAVRTYLFADTTNRIDIALGAEVIQHLLRLPLRYFDKRPVGELQTRIGELGNIRGFLTGSLLTLVLDSVFSVIYIAVMVMYSGVLTAVTLGVVPLFLGLTLLASPAIRAQLRKAAEKNAATQAFLIESLNGVQTIKAQNAEKHGALALAEALFIVHE